MYFLTKLFQKMQGLKVIRKKIPYLFDITVLHVHDSKIIEIHVQMLLKFLKHVLTDLKSSKFEF